MARARAMKPGVVAIAALVTFVAPSVAAGQSAPQPEARVDVIGPSAYSVQPGLGLNVALGYYARVGGVLGYAPSADARFIGDHWRVDAIARFLLDPFRQQRWALSVGGGVSIRRQTYLAALLDLEGPPMSGVVPAVELGVSGGVRAGVIVRRALAGRR